MTAKRHRTAETVAIGEVSCTIELERARNTSGKEAVSITFTRTPFGDSRDQAGPTQTIKMDFDTYDELDTVIRAFLERNRDSDPQR